MIKELFEFISFIVFLLVICFLVNYKDLEKNGMKLYYDKSKHYVHDLWYGR